MERENETFDVARGDVGLSRYLRDSLKRVRSSSVADSDLGRRLDDVLAGRTSLREFGMSEDFARVLERVSDQPLNQVAAMSEQERTRLAALAEAELERRGQQIDDSHPAPVEHTANRDEIFVYEDPDEADDAYYQERRQRGWLI